MRTLSDTAADFWRGLGPRLLPFADVASTSLPLSRLLRLSLFQVTVGMAAVLLMGTLNRVMIVELGVAAWLVAAMLSLPLIVAPLRALIGHRSDVYQSYLGWRRVPFLWLGTLLQFGGLAIMPFALIVMSGDTHGPVLYGQLAAMLAFLLVGAGMHMSQTVGLALATDLVDEGRRPRIVALLFVMLLLGMFFSALLFGWLLRDFSQLRLIKVIQGAAAVTLILNLCALWKQEPRRPKETLSPTTQPFRQAWMALRSDRRTMRLLVAVALGTAGFAMQDVLLEPFGGEVLGLTVGATTGLTALLAGGMLVAFAVAAKQLARGSDPHRVAAYGALVGIVAFAIVTVMGSFRVAPAFAVGVTLIGFGGGLFGVGTLTAAMNLTRDGNAGLALGAWGAVQATASGVAIALGGVIRDGVNVLAASGSLGVALSGPATGYDTVYLIEVVLLFATLAVIGPLAGFVGQPATEESGFGLAEFPG